MKYTIKIILTDNFITGFWKNKTYKNCIGHFKAGDIPNYLIVILDGEKRILFNLYKIIRIELDERFFLKLNSEVKKDSHGQADFSDRIQK